MHNNNEYPLFLNSFETSGLECISDTNEVSTVITSLENIVPSERYQNNSFSSSNNQKECCLDTKVFPDRIIYKNKIPIIEWNGIPICGDKVFLLEAKHKMTAIIACGTLFTDGLRSRSTDKGLIDVFPSGNRYKVEAPHELSYCEILICIYL
ncbi:hypothetical protein GLOIN_2v1738427 [Rhizophagus clarus]|uniref:Uncharacterized protein n=1 Tax=Rhizophagus clarus TaxID=94130 RepID=A0A8H3KSK0_9GLOM|nr:hypothetical protein GLOIN_2v1738427 [Rhizophagus clarus]